MQTRPSPEPVAHRRHRKGTTMTRLHRTRRYLAHWAPYWMRMSAIGLAAGILLAGLFNQAMADTFNHAQPPQVTHTGP